MNVRLFALVAVAALGLAATVFGQGVPTPVGQIRAVRIVGDVTVTHGSTQTTAALRDNDSLTQGDIVTTAKGSSVVLVFSNGSTINLGQDSRMSIDEFLQDPFSQDVKVSELADEPSKSQTKLALTYGELVGNVKKLHSDSSFLVQTPVGAAGIRGTTFRLVYRPTGSGQAFFTLSTASGEMIFQGTSGTPIPVPANKEVDIQVTINDATGAIESVQVTSKDITPEAAQLIEQAVTQVLESTKDTVFPGTGTPSEEGQQQQPPAPPPPEPPPPTTPGDGSVG
jgi:hypothetical protein